MYLFGSLLMGLALVLLPVASAAQEAPELVLPIGHTEAVLSVAFSPDGRYLASGSNDKTLKLWEVATGKEVRTLQGHTELVSSVAFSPDGRYLASGSVDSTLKVWEVATAQSTKSHPRCCRRSVAVHGLIWKQSAPLGTWGGDDILTL